MKRISLVISFAALAVSVSSPALAADSGYLVRLKPSHSFATQAQLESLGLTVEKRIPQLDMVFSKTAPNLSRADVKSAVLYVEPNYKRKAAIYETGLQRNASILARVGRSEGEQLWGMRQIKAEEAWAISTGSKDIVMAISDTGMFEHLELAPNAWRNPGENGLDANGKDKAKNKKDDDGNGFVDDFGGAGFDGGYSNNTYDRHYHGTHVSGTAGAFAPDRTGVAGPVWNAQIMPVPFIGGDGWGSDEGAIQTILYAADNGARVLNGSWGGSDNTRALRDAIDYAGQKGLLMVFAAGNDGTDTDKNPHYPSAFDSPYIISVAASSASGWMAGFSNYGKVSVDLGAPGEDVYSSFNPLCNCAQRRFYDYLSGTSMASPHVAGAAALVLSINPRLTNLEVKQILLSTVTPDADFAKTVSGGILNLAEAAKLAKQTLQ
ncbi:MAG TPA: S8 family peptidase [Bdellovibrionota bacterium]|nr:S8 family peptidase [Bdellovibrionota bacterium]